MSDDTGMQIADAILREHDRVKAELVDLRTRVAALESRWLHTADAYTTLDSDWHALNNPQAAEHAQQMAHLIRSHAAELRDLLEATP